MFIPIQQIITKCIQIYPYKRMNLMAMISVDNIHASAVFA